MAEQVHPIDISNNPALRQLVQEARVTNTARPVVMDDQVVATLVPRPVDQPPRRTPAKRTRLASRRNESLLRLIGIAGSTADGVHDVSVNHDKYLADAYLNTHA